MPGKGYLRANQDCPLNQSGFSGWVLAHLQVRQRKPEQRGEDKEPSGYKVPKSQTRRPTSNDESLRKNKNTLLKAGDSIKVRLNSDQR
jgi:hypothetical protein